MTIVCGHCGKRLSVPAGKTGQRLKCPQCGNGVSSTDGPGARPVATAQARATGAASSPFLFRFGMSLAIVGAAGAILPLFGLQLRKLGTLPPGAQIGGGVALLVLGMLCIAVSSAGGNVRRWVLRGALAAAALFVLLVAAAFILPLLTRPKPVSSPVTAVAPANPAAPSMTPPPGPPPVRGAPPTLGGPQLPGAPPTGLPNIPPPPLEDEDPTVVKIVITGGGQEAHDRVRQALVQRKFKAWRLSSANSRGEVVARVRSDVSTVLAWAQFGQLTRVDGRTIQIAWSSSTSKPASTRPAAG